ncbi:MAG: hypothetical protein E7616_01785 [Ruminococcaceae bacterium]|nr:hypothetical protein [Oscillospiraceae bacterium]
MNRRLWIMKKTLAYLLAAVMLLTFFPMGGILSQAEEITTLIAATDFQPKEGAATGIKKVNKIISAIKADGITSADGFLFCGDYDFGTFGVAEETKEGIDLLTESVSGLVDEKNMVFIQGNHDAVPGTSGLNPGGNNDPESGKYGVFVINNDDYMWHNEDEVRIKRTAQKLINYLNEKLAVGYDKPIFVLSHLPLHYNMRTKQDGDGKYANHIFNVLNEAGQKGLNIIFLFGHDHSQGWDDYLGGSSIYLTKGDEILVANSSQTVFKSHTLNFTYMNAGYVGYYDNHNGADDALTMTSFRIMGSSVVITRYDSNGIHNLKSEGVTNSYKGESGYTANTKVYPPRQTLALTQVGDRSAIKDLINLNESGRQYKRINHVDELKDGGKYLVVYNDTTDQILVPKVITKSNNQGTRVGFHLQNAYNIGDFEVYGNYATMEWTFAKAGQAWFIGHEGLFATLTPTNDFAITATLEAQGSAFVIEGEATYTFKSGNYVLNYNARGLMNAYTSDPASFYIYEYVGHTIDVTGGSAAVDGKPVRVADVGEVITLTADEAPKGQFFAGWEVEKGDITLKNEAVTTFTMPEGAVKIKAVYTETDPNAPIDEPTVDKNEGGLSWTVIVIVSTAVLAIAAVGVALVVKRKKK